MENSQDTLNRDRPSFTMIADAIIEDERVSRAALLVYIVLCKHADNESGKCWPGYDRIAKLSRYSRRTVIEAVEELISLGYILKLIRPRKSNLYKIVKKYEHQKEVKTKPQRPSESVTAFRGAITAPKLYQKKIEDRDPPVTPMSETDKTKEAVKKIKKIFEQKTGKGIYYKTVSMIDDIKGLRYDDPRLAIQTYMLFINCWSGGTEKLCEDSGRKQWKIFVKQDSRSEWLIKLNRKQGIREPDLEERRDGASMAEIEEMLAI